MADPERGRDRVRRGGVDVDRHPRRQRVIGAPVAPGEKMLLRQTTPHEFKHFKRLQLALPLSVQI